jgi:hypothetical protein
VSTLHFNSLLITFNHFRLAPIHFNSHVFAAVFIRFGRLWHFISERLRSKVLRDFVNRIKSSLSASNGDAFFRKCRNAKVCLRSTLPLDLLRKTAQSQFVQQKHKSTSRSINGEKDHDDYWRCSTNPDDCEMALLNRPTRH